MSLNGGVMVPHRIGGAAGPGIGTAGPLHFPQWVCADANRSDLNAPSGRRAEASGAWAQIPQKKSFYILFLTFITHSLSTDSHGNFNIIINTGRMFWISLLGIIIFPPRFSPSQESGPNFQRSLSSYSGNVSSACTSRTCLLLLLSTH